MFDLTGMTALVTGASGGIGSAIADALAAQGARLALSGTREERLREVAARIGGDPAILPCDLSDGAAVDQLVPRAVEALGQLDILVNNAGGGVDERPVEDYAEDVFDFVLDLNVKSTFFLSQYAGKHMRARGRGAIVNMGSQAGAIALPGEAVYCLSKAAVSHMTKCFAVEWGKNNVRVNCVAPTFIETDGTADMLARPEFRAEVIERIAALHRIGQPREVADAVVFLASDAASMITGQTLLIDGGWTAR